MNKVGIITWIRYENYGTVLQATALAEVIRQLGYSPVEIDYRPRSINDDSKFNILEGLPRGAKFLKNIFNGVYESTRKTELYHKYLSTNLSVTEPCNTTPELMELNKDFDAFICGSDQIWSPAGFDEKYFLSFVNNPEKMIAYAPSFGLPEIKNAIIAKKMKVLINRFVHLAVREQQGAEIIYKLCGKRATVVLDPTLLLSPHKWKKFEEQADYGQQNMPEKYIICYFLGDYSRYMKTVKAMSKVLNMPYFVIPQFKKQVCKSDAVPFEVGPAEFLKLWAHASYAITDSFHGLAFSLNYNIPYTVFKRFSENDPLNQNSRIINILKLTGMEKRLVDEKN